MRRLRLIVVMRLIWGGSGLILRRCGRDEALAIPLALNYRQIGGVICGECGYFGTPSSGDDCACESVAGLTPAALLVLIRHIGVPLKMFHVKHLPPDASREAVLEAVGATDEQAARLDAYVAFADGGAKGGQSYWSGDAWQIWQRHIWIRHSCGVYSASYFPQ